MQVPSLVFHGFRYTCALASAAHILKLDVYEIHIKTILRLWIVSIYYRRFSHRTQMNYFLK